MVALISAHACPLRWLQYHDRDAADLCGMLPLALGQRVSLTHHIDRSPDKLLLKGKTGRIHSWKWNDNDGLPEALAHELHFNCMLI